MKAFVFPKKVKHFLFQQPVGYILCLIFFVSISFYPALDNEFVHWDDQFYVFENPFVIQPTLEHLKMLWTHIISLNYHPITMVSLWGNAFLSGAETAFPFIATNIILHLFNTLLVFFLIKKLSDGNLLIPFVTALIFGIHPMHVESVVWVSERKDVLYGFFFLLASNSYLQYLEQQKPQHYALTFILFLLACGSKATAVAFVPVLFLFDFFRKRKWNTLKIYVEKIPFVMIALLVGWIAINVQAGGDFYGLLERTSDASAISRSEVSIWKKIEIGSFGLFFYIQKFFFPSDLAALHPYVSAYEKSYFHLLPIFAIILLGSLIYSFFKYPKIAYGLSFFLLTIFLVLQFIPVGVAIVAERYAYLPYLGLAYLVGLFLKQKTNTIPVRKMLTPLLIFAGFFSYLTRTHVNTWQNHNTLFGNVVNIYPNDPYGREYLATGLWMEGHLDSAIVHLEYAIDNLNYNNTNAFEILAICWDDKQETEKALFYFDKAIQADANNLTAYYHRSLTLIPIDPKRALTDLNYCERSNNENLKQLIYEPRARCYGALKEYEKAIQDFTTALNFTVDKKMIYYNRGVSYELLGQPEKAIVDYQTALELDITFEDARQRMALLKD